MQTHAQVRALARQRLVERRVAARQPPDDARGVAVVQSRTDAERIRPEEDAHLGPLRRGHAFFGIALREGGHRGCARPRGRSRAPRRRGAREGTTPVGASGVLAQGYGRGATLPA